MIRVGIVGATGYTALELITILLRHPEVQITSVTSRDEECPPIEMVHTSLRKRLDLRLEKMDVEHFSTSVDCAFSCLPHAASAEIVSQLLDHSIRVVDFSADYRLQDVNTFESWYKVTHPDPVRVGNVPYGIPELFREQIGSAQVVANPGCFPTSCLIPVAPLVKSGLISDGCIIVDSKTGVSGAGRKANLKFHFPECNESLAAYAVGTHRHMPEMEDVIERYSGKQIETVFTPHLVPMDRGILSTIYLPKSEGLDSTSVLDTWQQYYRNEPFIRITNELPSTKDVANSNFCDITVRQCGDQVIVLSALDNLIKGASGAAVQNFNLMYGFDETTGLL